MPRFVDRTKNPRKSSYFREKNKKFRTFKRDWQDPYPTILGTRPEKMIYAALMLRGINFYFQSMLLVNLPAIQISKEYRPDFILPDQKIIIEVQGVYFHSKPETIESDAYKQALYNMLGYKVLTWWDYDIERNVWDLIASEPLIASIQASGGRITTANDKIIDDLKGLRTTNARRFRGKSARIKVSSKRRRKAQYSYGI